MGGKWQLDKMVLWYSWYYQISAFLPAPLHTPGRFGTRARVQEREIQDYIHRLKFPMAPSPLETDLGSLWITNKVLKYKQNVSPPLQLQISFMKKIRKFLWLQSLVVQPSPSRNFFLTPMGYFFFFAFRKECNWFVVLNKHCTYMPSVMRWMWILAVSCSANTLKMNKHIHLLCNILVKYFYFMKAAVCSDSAHHAALNKLSVWSAASTDRKYCARAG